MERAEQAQEYVDSIRAGIIGNYDYASQNGTSRTEGSWCAF